MRSMHAVHAAGVTIVALAVLVFGSVPAAADGKRKGNTLRLDATETGEFLDLGAPGLSVGDEIVFSAVFESRGREVGTGGGVCTAVEVVPPYTTTTYQCVATMSLRRGQITLQGLVEIQGAGDMSPFTVAITGGTGAYRGAGGEARIRPVSDSERIYKLRFDSHDKHKKKNKKRSRPRHR